MTKRIRCRYSTTTHALAQVAACWLMIGCQVEIDAGFDAAPPVPPVLDAGAGPSPMDAALPPSDALSDASAPRDAAALHDASSAPRDAAAPLDSALPQGDAAVLLDGGSAFDLLAQQCVDTINRYRATLGIAPLRRATPEQEACSNRGAQKDGKANSPHSSAGDCKGFGAQNSCPGWGFGPRTPYSSLSAALDGCLASMWAEGAPPVPVSACISDYLGCFMKHGHYINMVDTSNQVVACGFFDMGKDKFWMNQDFGR